MAAAVQLVPRRNQSSSRRRRSRPPLSPPPTSSLTLQQHGPHLRYCLSDLTAYDWYRAAFAPRPRRGPPACSSRSSERPPRIPDKSTRSNPQTRSYPRLTLDFHTNKRLIDEVAVVPSKRLRNKIAGFTTHLMKRIQRGPVRGISFKLQEEERERKDQYVPEVSALDTTVSGLEVDPDTKVIPSYDLQPDRRLIPSYRTFSAPSTSTRSRSTSSSPSLPCPSALAARPGATSPAPADECRPHTPPSAHEECWGMYVLCSVVVMHPKICAMHACSESSKAAPSHLSSRDFHLLSLCQHIWGMCCPLESRGCSYVPSIERLSSAPRGLTGSF